MMSSELSHEQHTDRGFHEEVRGVSADNNTARGRQRETKRKRSQCDGEATNAGRAIRDDSSKSDRWSNSKSSNLRELTSHAYKFQPLSLIHRFGKTMLMTRNPFPSPETEPLLRLHKRKVVSKWDLGSKATKWT
jgi:hypothetical protein